MSQGINPQKSQFVYLLPNDFVPQSIEAKYKDFLIRNHIVYDSILDYLNSTIMGFNMPALEFPTVEQTTRYGKKIAYRSAVAPYDTLSREGRIRFKGTDDLMNYFIMQDVLMYHYININEIFVNPFQMLILDKNRDLIFKYIFREIVMTGLAGVEYGHEKTDLQFDVFELGFKTNFIDYEYVPSKKMPILVKTPL